MNFVRMVFELADKLDYYMQNRDLEGVKAVKQRQAFLWANASDEDLKQYAPYYARRFGISEEDAFFLLKNVRSLHQKRLGGVNNRIQCARYY